MRSRERRSVGVFSRGGRLYIQPYHRTTAGVLLGGSPVQVLDYNSSDEEIGQALHRALGQAKRGGAASDRLE